MEDCGKSTNIEAILKNNFLSSFPIFVYPRFLAALRSVFMHGRKLKANISG
jgi:hypothetical protein